MGYVERNHFRHRHTLVRTYSELSFECNGCHRDGIGFHFNCHGCGLNLHTQCADAALTYGVLTHPFYGNCQFEFFPCPPKDSSYCCSACDQQVEGFVYNCRCGRNLHPRCAALPPEIRLDNGQWFYLWPEAPGPCNHCGQMRESWSYMSDCKKYNFHVTCVMDMWLESREDNHHRNRKGKVKKGWKKVKKCWKKGWKKGGKLVSEELMRMILSAVLAAVLGDPTAIFQ